MGGPIRDSAQKRKKSRKKRKSRTEVSSSSESDSDVSTRPQTKPKPSASAQEVDTNGDVSMADAYQSTPEPQVSASTETETAADETNLKAADVTEEFTSMYVRKVAEELAEDLDKVRQANDFTSRSVPMLVHALKLGVSCFTPEERARMVAATR